VGSFGGFIDHLAHRQAILHDFSSGLDLLSLVQTITPAFFGC
jgi:hypothetical protein